jgi:Trk K+ transport system NAD-binding subunit
MPAKWVGRTVGQVEDERDLRVIRLKRGGAYVGAKSATKLEAKDRVVVDADADAMQEFA